MNAPGASSVDVDTLMSRIRAEVARRKQVDAAIPAMPVHAAALRSLPMLQLPKAQFSVAERYHLNDFLALHDLDFIDAAYRGLLKRAADAEGKRHFLEGLRGGRLSKIEILGRLRYSPEGRRHGVRVRGLLPAFAVQHATRLPVIGGMVGFAMGVVRLPRYIRSLQGLEGYLHQRNAELEVAIRQLAQAADANESSLGREIVRGEDSTKEALRRVETKVETLGQQMEVAAGELYTQLGVLMETVAGNQRELADWRETSAQREVNALARFGQMEQRIATGESRADQFAQGAILFESARKALESKAAQFESDRQSLENRVGQIEMHKQEIDRRLIGVIALAQESSTQLATTLRHTVDVIERRLDVFDNALSAERDGGQTAQLRLTERMARLEGRVHEHSRHLGDASKPVQWGASEIPASASGRFDEIYYAFEQRFRGSREDIRKRVAYYLPLLRDSIVGKQGAGVLDIGCGRGEWLELLRDENIGACGIDINEAMAKDCIERGLDVQVGDAIAHLRRLPDNALGALTGFHIIEHVPLDTLIELIEEAHRVIQPGGLVIFETPNPENVVVGACNFYIDPTHQRPLPPVLTQFLVEAGGFVDVAVHRVNTELLPEVFDSPGENDPPALRTALAYLRGVFLCAPDYAVVGRVE